ncbi:C6 transcription factor (Ctf1B) [Penicillium hetheringtonii]|uniref:C6 transcription factor (Ctf1B) n=1 Tax=Penicillium hetheringtonii TaxID=911720 RepID=A0AAD6DII6_9EURO|nr:C6 transcription factor (Ctf1B) [Penicillium hetheringtonii]
MGSVVGVLRGYVDTVSEGKCGVTLQIVARLAPIARILESNVWQQQRETIFRRELFLQKWKDVEVEALFKSIATYENYDRESKGETVNLQNRIISPSPIMNEWAFGYLIDEPRPAFIKTSSAHLEDCEMQYLRVKGALSIPKEEFRRDLLRAFIRRVYYVFPMVNIFDFLSAIVLDDGRHPISLLLFQAVMLSAIPYINIDRLVVEGFCSRKQAQDVFLQRVMALYNVGYETEQLPMIQASFLLSLTDDPVAVKDSWYWLGTSLSFAQAVNFHLDTPGYCKGEKGLPRRIWWSIFTQDKILALSMKYPCRIRDDTYQVPMLVLDDFELHRADPAIHSIVGQDMRIQDTEYQKKLALITIQTATMSVVIGEILMLQYIPSLRASSNGELPSITVIPRRTATRQDIRLYESKLALCMKFQNAESQWNGAEANRHLGTSEGETLLLIQAETSLMHLTTLMALYRPQVRPAQSATSIGSDLQVYSQHQAKSVATEILEICNILKENGLLPQLSHTTVLSVYQAALIHLSFLNSADAVEQMLGFNKFDQLVRLLKDMDDIHITAKLGASLLHSIVQKAAFV